MELSTFERIRSGLVEKRQNLTQWLNTTPAQKKNQQLGPAQETGALAQLDAIDRALYQAADQSLGVCQVCHDYVETDLLEMDYTACVCLAHLSTAELRKLERELELSQVIQRALLPQQPPAIPGLDLAVFSRPAQIVGGDYFDFLRFRDGSHGFVVADVMGHGVSASMIMASVQTALRTLVPESDSPAQVLQRINRFFLHNIHFPTFVTLFLARLDQQTGSLQYANAGHNPPLLHHQSDLFQDPVDWLAPTGPAIGLIEDFIGDEDVIKPAPGDTLVLYTDGVTEATSPQGQMFGQERLAQLLGSEAWRPARDLVRLLRHSLEEFTGGEPMADDTTLVVCKINEASLQLDRRPGNPMP